MLKCMLPSFLHFTHVSSRRYVRTAVINQLLDGREQAISALVDGLYQALRVAQLESAAKLLLPEDFVRRRSSSFLQSSYLYQSELVSGKLYFTAEDIIPRLSFINFRRGSNVPGWLCDWLRAASSSTLRGFLQFVTGLATLPTYSAAGSGGRVIAVERASSASLCPCAYTCAWQLELPEYDSARELADRMDTALRSLSGGFLAC